jgi:hypothetical protein
MGLEETILQTKHLKYFLCSYCHPLSMVRNEALKLRL